MTPRDPDALPAPPEVPEDQKQVSRKELLAYSLGACGEPMVTQSINILATPILNIALGVNPALIGLVISGKSLWDALTDPVMGQISDNHRGPRGRRRPFILLGSLLTGFVGLLVWWIQPGWSEWAILAYFALILLVLTVCTTIFSVPYYAMGIEIGPTYHQRTRVVAYRSIVQTSVGLLSPWFYWFCLLPVFNGELNGARWLSAMTAVVCIIVGIVVYRSCKERTGVTIETPKEPFWPAAKRIASNPNFLRVLSVFITLVLILGTFTVFSLYLNIYYVFGGDKNAGAKVVGILGTLGTVCAMLAIPFVTWFSKRYQKHNALRLALGMMTIGQILNWFLLTPATPYAQIITPFFYSFGISAVFTVLSSMQADVVDDDELRSGQRREGIFGAVAAWMLKSAGALAVALSGFLVTATGFDVALGASQPDGTFFWMRLLNSFVPAAFLILCIALLYRYPLTEERMNEIRAILDARKAHPGDLSTPSAPH